MNINKKNLTIYCHICKRNLDLYTEIIIPKPEVLCLYCLILLGFEWDLVEIFGESFE
jgi:hypothetical protein